MRFWLVVTVMERTVSWLVHIGRAIQMLPVWPASVAYARLHTSERFLEQMKKARKEFKDRQNPTVVPHLEMDRQPSTSTRAYTINGTPANDRTRGVVISQGQKTVRR